ncbi:hypothetical protein [Kutzneria sp. NPDC052558]|uniref:hypothetical protein n=1 Tax=Kutzneria sp. NPDC052558 TaxID=3364121 RepID=UPI0037C9CA33
MITKIAPAVLALTVIAAGTAQAATAAGTPWSVNYQQASASGAITSDHAQFPQVKATGTLTVTGGSGCYHVTMVSYKVPDKPVHTQRTKSGPQCGKGSLPVSLSAVTNAFFTEVMFKVCADDNDTVCGPATTVTPN